MKTSNSPRIKILAQPDDTTCGPTSLHAVYRHYGLQLSLEDVIDSVHVLEEGGTLGVLLGIDALKRDFDVTIYPFNLKLFDPSWRWLSNSGIADKLRQQLKYKDGKKFTLATEAYLHFIELGGNVEMELLSPTLLRNLLTGGNPVLTGLSATYLYQSHREFVDRQNRCLYDDLRGDPSGHFVVLTGYDGDTIDIADPYEENPLSDTLYYKMDVYRLMSSIMLGIVTYDANLLAIRPKTKK